MFFVLQPQAGTAQRFAVAVSEPINFAAEIFDCNAAKLASCG